MEYTERFKLIKDIPLLRKGMYDFDVESGYVYMVENGERAEYPLRNALGGYLWLLRTEKGYLRRV